MQAKPANKLVKGDVILLRSVFQDASPWYTFEAWNVIHVHTVNDYTTSAWIQKQGVNEYKEINAYNSATEYMVL